MKTTIQNLGITVLVAAAAGCVSQRPSRNGVFNENQYVRKDFLVPPQANGAQDPGWFLNATVTQVSTPNPLGDIIAFPGLDSADTGAATLVRFRVTEDSLEMLNQREITSQPGPSGTPEVVNAWPVTNVDIKYRVNLDGEVTNFIEENQELDWQVRQWVKLKLAKNSMSDFAPFGTAWTVLNACTDTANINATLVPNSFVTYQGKDAVADPDYMQWKVQLALPLRWDDPNCVTAFGSMGQTSMAFGRLNSTVTLMYSLKRAQTMDQLTYKPLEIAEKDPIRHKYGWFDTIAMNRDNDTGLLSAKQFVSRWDPQKQLVWYFAPGFPDNWKQFFTKPNGIKDQTNQLLADSGAPMRVDFKDYNQDLAPGQPDREYGDVRYNFFVWLPDRDIQGAWAGVTTPMMDPRTGEMIHCNIFLNDFAIKDYYVQRLDAYLQSLGASSGVNLLDQNGQPMEWPDAPPGKDANCADGDTAPIVTDAYHSGSSSMFAKMQEYLQKPVGVNGYLGPQDFIIQQDSDFFNAYYALLPYYVFADPDMNPFVIREGGSGVYGADTFMGRLQKETQFQQLAASIDRGEAPYTVGEGTAGVTAATDFLNKFRDLTNAHKDYVYAQNFLPRHQTMDAPQSFSYESVAAKDARHCVGGKWETKQQWIDGLINTYWSQVIWHEFGHSMGLAHNFMGNIDRNNFPHYTDGSGTDHIAMYSNSVMEYNALPDRVFWGQGGWAPYDQGAITWIYANTAPDTSMGTQGPTISGQIDAKHPWVDPHGFATDGTTETQYLYCSHQHLKYTPLCRQGDLGTTPSEIIANQLDSYEWNFAWRNFRKYRKFWDNSAYANTPAGTVTDLKRFISLWVFDWSAAELADSLRRIGIKPPTDGSAPSALQYYGQLTNKFNKEISAANQMVAAFHEAVIQQTSGERPFRTVYDKYFGDTTQQGIILDKLFAMQGWVGLWPTDNYDANQAGSYIASYSSVGDSSYTYVAEQSITSMIGGNYDAYPYFPPLAVAQFAQDTHSPSFNGRIEIRDWIGGHVFYRLQDFLDFFRDLATKNGVCASFATCTYDPRDPANYATTDQKTHNEFIGPDERTWIWAYVQDRNTWVAVQKERNIASYIIVRNYTDDVIYQQDDGNFPGGAYGALLPMKYYLDSFNMYN